MPEKVLFSEVMVEWPDEELNSCVMGKSDVVKTPQNRVMLRRLRGTQYVKNEGVRLMGVGQSGSSVGHDDVNGVTGSLAGLVGDGGCPERVAGGG